MLSLEKFTPSAVIFPGCHFFDSFENTQRKNKQKMRAAKCKIKIVIKITLLLTHGLY
jgi:uncharacterized ParB-like nuclease family protein